MYSLHVTNTFATGSADDDVDAVVRSDDARSEEFKICSDRNSLKR